MKCKRYGAGGVIRLVQRLVTCAGPPGWAGWFDPEASSVSASDCSGSSGRSGDECRASATPGTSELQNTHVVSTDQSHDGTLMWRQRSLRWNVCVTSALFFSSFRSSTFSCSCNRCYRWVTTSVTFSLGQISAGPPKRTSSSCFCILIRCSASCSCGEKLGLSPAEAESKSSWRRTESGSQACAITF